MNPTSGFCLGCYRTLDEIATWGRMTDADKRKVWSLLPERKANKIQP